ncbi:MAG: PA domain-containing protein [Crocinitomicaceae bacterium]|nr:T9SS type A sorting domain-containing protein [Taishania sp.]
MKKLILSLFIAGGVGFGFSQMTVTGVSPASIVGNYTFSYGETTSGWGSTMNFSTPGVHVQGYLALVEDGTTGTNAQGHPISQEGCSPLTNGSSVTGKIAVVYRNTCEFGDKAKNAQDAGAIAVIVVNRDNEVIAMGGGTQGPNVTIPVVMLTSLDGALLVNEMANGPVEVFIGNKAGIGVNDLAFTEDLILTPLYNGVHSLLAQNGTDFNMELGMRVYNYGSGAQTGAKACAKITGPGNVVVYGDTVAFDLDGVTGSTIDSVDIFPGEALSFNQFSLASYPAGDYKLEYQLLTGDGSDDDFPNDNYYTITFTVNDSYISKSRFDAANSKPVVNSYTRPADQAQPYSEVRYCTNFINANASRLAALGMKASISIDTSKAPSLSGKTIYAEVFKWNDAISITAPTFDNLESVASAEYNFVNEVDTEDVHFIFDDPLYLEDAQSYLFCLINYGEYFYIGYDRNVDFNATMQQYNEPMNPLYIMPGQNNQNWFLTGFGSDMTPSIAIHAINQAEAKLNALSSLSGSAYPNPANDVINFNIALDGKATIVVTDVTGKQVASNNVSFVSNTASMNISNLVNGMYIVNVNYENGANAKFNFVKK